MVDLTSQISERMGLKINDCLQLSRRVEDQSGLSRSQRVSNMKDAFSLKSDSIVRGDLIVIDDVVTTLIFNSSGQLQAIIYL